MIKMENLVQRIKSVKNIALFLHVRPDGDAIGSGLALKRALNLLNKNVDVYCDDVIPERFFYLEGATEIKSSDIQTNYDCLIAVDCADITRIGKYAPNFSAHKNTLVIDHHETNRGFSLGDYVKDLPANCENIYYLINQLGVEIDSVIANALATGILTDTGGLRHSNVNAQIVSVLASLVEKGANLNLISYKMFKEQSKERAKLFGLTMSSLRYFYDNKIVIGTVDSEKLKISNAKQDETEGFIDFIMGIQGVEVGACLLQLAENKFKVSLRGKTTNVAEVAQVFGGGGHCLASGCQIFGEYEEVVDKLVYAIKQHVKE